MKKFLFTTSTVLLSISSAYSQGSVTLYGLVDAGFLYSNNVGGQKLYAMSSGNLQGSRWGLKGTEDLGGGMKAIFVLENGFNVMTGALGQGGNEFGRQAYVGVSVERYGT